MITITTASIGANMDAVVTAKAVPVSTVETTGLPKPPVVAVEANLPAAPAPLIAVAVPPPAIIANDQVTTGSKFATVETITAVPAMAAKGTAKLSNKLSTQGIKYANISTNVATPRVITAAKLPIHCQLSFNSQTLKYDARLSANKGRKTLKPTDAAKPIPKKILIMVSDVIFFQVQVQVQASSIKRRSALSSLKSMPINKRTF